MHSHAPKPNDANATSMTEQMDDDDVPDQTSADFPDNTSADCREHVTYDLTFPQQLLESCLYLPCNVRKWMNASSTHAETPFRVGLLKNDDAAINIILQGVQADIFESASDTWRCCVEKLTPITESDVGSTSVLEDTRGSPGMMGSQLDGSVVTSIGNTPEETSRGAKRKGRQRVTATPGVTRRSSRCTKRSRFLDGDIFQVSASPRKKHAKTELDVREAVMSTVMSQSSDNEDECSDEKPDCESPDVEGEPISEKEEALAAEEPSGDSDKAVVYGEEGGAGDGGRGAVAPPGQQRTAGRRKWPAREELAKHKRACHLCAYVCYTLKTLRNHAIYKHHLSWAVYNGTAAVVSVKPEPAVEPAPPAPRRRYRQASDPSVDAHSCPECPRRFIVFATLQRHLRLLHPGVEVSAPLKRISAVVIDCVVCGVTLHGVRSISHIQREHADHADFEDILELTKNRFQSQRCRLARAKQPAGKVACKHCGQLYDRNGVRAHMLYRCRANPARRPLHWCRSCGYGTPFADHLRAHVKLHADNGQHSYVCDACGRTYATRAGLSMHTRSMHTPAEGSGEKQDNMCELCGKTFEFAFRLTRHLKIHSREREHKCELCPSAFKASNTLKRHRETYHFGRYKFRCADCGHGVDKQHYLDKHKCGRVKRGQTACRDGKEDGQEDHGGQDDGQDDRDEQDEDHDKQDDGQDEEEAYRDGQMAYQDAYTQDADNTEVEEMAGGSMMDDANVIDANLETMDGNVQMMDGNMEVMSMDVVIEQDGMQIYPNEAPLQINVPTPDA